MIASAYSGRQRVWSISSSRSRNVPSTTRAACQPSSAERTCPRCRYPVGLGAKRVTTPRGIARFIEVACVILRATGRSALRGWLAYRPHAPVSPSRCEARAGTASETGAVPGRFAGRRCQRPTTLRVQGRRDKFAAQPQFAVARRREQQGIGRFGGAAQRFLHLWCSSHTRKGQRDYSLKRATSVAGTPANPGAP